jgi:CRISPR-associated exonuclease Cas4
VIDEEDVGGVHIKYLYHCRRQLWLYLRGIRPERLSGIVRLGEAIHDTSYSRNGSVDLGAAQLDFIDGQHWVHEVKSSSRPTSADQAQGRHYCYQLRLIGVDAQGAILHYPKTRRTHRYPYTPQAAEQARADIAEVLGVAASQVSPGRLVRTACRGCAFTDYCWME